MGKGRRRVHCSLAHAHTLSGVVVIAVFRAGIMPSRGLGTFHKIFSAHSHPMCLVIRIREEAVEIGISSLDQPCSQHYSFAMKEG